MRISIHEFENARLEIIFLESIGFGVTGPYVGSEEVRGWAEGVKECIIFNVSIFRLQYKNFQRLNVPKNEDLATPNPNGRPVKVPTKSNRKINTETSYRTLE